MRSADWPIGAASSSSRSNSDQLRGDNSAARVGHVAVGVRTIQTRPFVPAFRKLRTGYGGLLRMNPVFSEYGLKDLLPLKLDIPDEGCTRPNRSMYCFEAGESVFPMQIFPPISRHALSEQVGVQLDIIRSI